jgi:hypothetical protein
VVWKGEQGSKIRRDADGVEVRSVGEFATCIITMLYGSSVLQALRLHPNDKAVLYNIAMIQQKAAELLFSIPPSKRSLEDLKHAVEQAGHAQRYVLAL